MVSRAASRRPVGPVMTRAICHFDNAYWLPDVAIHGYSRPHQHRRATPPFAASAGRRARWRSRTSSTRSRAGSAGSARRAPGQLLRHRRAGRPRRNVTPYGQLVEDNVIHELVAELEASSGYRARREDDRRVQRRQRGAQARPRPHAGEVRHLVQPRPPQPGRRAGARLRRRLGAGEPRRHRDGPGPQHQGRAGRRARARHRLRARCASQRHRHAQGRQHLGHRRLDRQRPERQGRAGRGAADPRAPGRLRRRALRRCRRRRALRRRHA